MPLWSLSPVFHHPHPARRAAAALLRAEAHRREDGPSPSVCSTASPSDTSTSSMASTSGTTRLPPPPAVDIGALADTARRSHAQPGNQLLVAEAARRHGLLLLAAEAPSDPSAACPLARSELPVRPRQRKKIHQKCKTLLETRTVTVAGRHCSHYA
jgi:hypothetical protein